MLIINENTLKQAADVLKNGGLAAFPTETVYGLGANAHDDAAVKRLFAVKERDFSKPISILIGDPDDMYIFCSEVTSKAKILADRFWPGALTMIMKKKGVSNVVTANQDTVGVRCPNSKIAREIIRHAKVPLAVTSANLSGHPSPVCADDVINNLDGKIDILLDGGVCSVGVESTVIDMTSDPPRILRQGGIPFNILSEALNGEIIGL